MIGWDNNNLAWYIRSGMLEPYGRDIALAIKDYIKDMDVIDAGCGPGVSSYFLSKYAKKVLGIDCQKDAIDFANDYFRNNDNMNFKVGNLFELNENSCDVVCGISIGPVFKENLNLLKVAKKYVILVSSLKRQVLPRKKTNNIDEETLIKHNVNFKKFEIDTSFGQAFKAEDEVEQFIKYHNLTDKYDDIFSSLKKTDGDFPLYLENKKQLRILVVESNSYDK